MPITGADPFNVIEVAVGLIENAAGEYLIALRHQSRHQGGLWEFPGGKIETGESGFDALVRELYEEVGIRVTQAHYLHDIRHDYPDKSVCLKLWHVSSFNGEAHGREDQPLQWVKPDQLISYEFPLANQPIISYLTQSAEI